MLDHSRMASSQRSWLLAGLGSGNNLQPYPDTLHRGYGWGRMLDSDFFHAPVVSNFHTEANRATAPAKKRDKSQFPSIRH